MLSFILLALSLYGDSSLATKETKALSLARQMYQLNINKIENAQFKTTKPVCEGDETIETCTFDILVTEKNPLPGGVSYKATFTNNQLSNLEQICRLCWQLD